MNNITSITISPEYLQKIINFKIETIRLKTMVVVTLIVSSVNPEFIEWLQFYPHSHEDFLVMKSHGSTTLGNNSINIGYSSSIHQVVTADIDYSRKVFDAICSAAHHYLTPRYQGNFFKRFANKIRERVQKKE